MSVVIGMAGGSASGKTSIANIIKERFPSDVLLIRQDDYYKDQTHKSMEERVKTNYDHPDAFDTELLVQHLKMLKSGGSVEKPLYDYATHNRSTVTEHLDSNEIIIIEGIFVLAQKEVRELCDILVFVDTDSDVRFIRRLVRDTSERGRSVESVCSQYLNTVKPMHEQFIEPSKRFAHVVIPEGGNNVVAIDLLITKIASILK